jgi:hypothetical protein
MTRNQITQKRRWRTAVLTAAAVVALSVLPASAQDECDYPLTIVLSDQVAANTSVTVQTQLESKLRQIVTHSGMTGGTRFSNFFISANLTEGSKNLTSGLRPLVTVSLDLELSVGNTMTGDRYAATSVRLSGAGPSEARAYVAAVSGVNAGSPQLQQFMKTARQRIKRYYDTQTSDIVKRARDFAVKQQFDEAFFLLTSVPACSSNYADVEIATLGIFQQYVDLDCSQKVAKARAVWAAGQDREAAKQAGAYLAAINPASSCTEDAQALIAQMSERIGEEWEWAKDLKEFGKEMALHEVDIRKMRIEAARAIGEAWANNQQPGVLIQNQKMESSKGGHQQMDQPRQSPDGGLPTAPAAEPIQ